MARLRPLRITLEAVDKLTAPIDRMARRVDAVRAPVRRLHTAFAKLSRVTGLSRIGSGLATLARRAGFAAGAIAAIGIAGFKRFINLGDEILTFANRVGISTDRLQELKLAAEQNDLTFAELKSGLKTFALNMGQANKGQGKFFSALKKTHPALVQQLINSKDVGEEFDIFADAVASATTAEGKLRIASAGLGKDLGAKFVTMLRNGRSGLQKYADEARSLGIIIEEGTLKRARALGDEFNKLKAVGVGLAASIAAGILPTVERITGQMTDWLNISSNREWLKTSVGEFATRIADGLDAVAKAVPVVIDQLGGLPGIVDKIQTAVVGLTGAVGLLAAAWALTPMGQIAIAGAGVAAIGKAAFDISQVENGWSNTGKTIMGGLFETGAARSVGHMFAPGWVAPPPGAPARVEGLVEVVVHQDGRPPDFTNVRSGSSNVVIEASRGRTMPHIR